MIINKILDQYKSEYPLFANLKLSQARNTEELRERLQELMHLIKCKWREKRKEKRAKKTTNQIGIDVETWYTKLPVKMKNGVENIVNTIITDSELEIDKQNSIVEDLHKLLPEYNHYHYRNLHTTIKKL